MGVALAELCPFLRQSIDWFELDVREQGMMSEVRSSELDTGLSSSGDPIKGDTAVSTPREVRAFYALEEVCRLDADSMGRLEIGFNFQREFVFVGPMTRIGLATSSLVRYASMRLPSLVALGSPSTRS